MTLVDNTDVNIGQVIQHHSASGNLPFIVQAFDATSCWIYGQWQSGPWANAQGWVPIQLLTSS